MKKKQDTLKYLCELNLHPLGSLNWRIDRKEIQGSGRKIASFHISYYLLLLLHVICYYIIISISSYLSHSITPFLQFNGAGVIQFFNAQTFEPAVSNLIHHVSRVCFEELFL